MMCCKERVKTARVISTFSTSAISERPEIHLRKRRFQ
jgi:hypothetical protein